MAFVSAGISGEKWRHHGGSGISGVSSSMAARPAALASASMAAASNEGSAGVMAGESGVINIVAYQHHGGISWRAGARRIGVAINISM